MLLILSQRKTSRLQYTCDTLMEAVGMAFDITCDVEQFDAFSGPKINYTPQPTTSTAFHIVPHTLLFEDNITPQNITCTNWKDHPTFFQSTGGDLPFDLFAASFYLLTCYEQYLPHSKDAYGRYAHTNSLAYTAGFLHLPLINLWLQHFAIVLQKQFPDLHFSPPAFRFIPTYDIDIAWSYFGKGALRNVGGLVKDIARLSWPCIKERMQVLLAYRNDPFDVYAWLDKLHEQHKLDPVYFFLLADITGKYDKNVDPGNPSFKLLVQKLAMQYQTGIHPSWRSGDEDNLLQEEIETLHDLSYRPVQLSRQHYIRMTFPTTYRALIAAGIREDYSLGYGSINGFAASYALPYYWYDVQAETTTTLRLYPFCFMDANALFEEKLTPEQALESLEHYYNITKKVNGTCITIFHNHLLTEQPGLKPWRELYETFLKKHY